MWVTYTTFILAVLCLMAASALLGYVWCLRVESKAQADASFWRAVARAWEADTGLCQTCGLEPYDPDCGCVCDCHHRCERVEASRG